MNVLTLRDKLVAANALRFSPDGRTLGLVARQGRNLLLVDVSTGAVRKLPAEFRYDEPLYGFAADGAEVVTFRTEQATVWDAAGGYELRTIRFSSHALGMAVAPDGRTLAVSLTDKGVTTIARFDVATGARLPDVGGDKPGIAALVFSADGTRLASGLNKQVRVWPIGTNPASRTLAVLKVTEGGWLRSVALSADGRYAAAVARTAAYLWDTQSKGRQPIVFSGRGRAAAAVAFHPSRPLFATAGTDRTVCFWDAASGEQVKKYAWKIGPITAVAFSSDGLQAAAAGEGRVVVWDVD